MVNNARVVNGGRTSLKVPKSGTYFYYICLCLWLSTESHTHTLRFCCWVQKHFTVLTVKQSTRRNNSQ